MTKNENNQRIIKCQWRILLTILKINFIKEIHFASNGTKDETLLTTIREGEFNLSIQSTRSQQSWVNSISTIGNHDDLGKEINE